MDIKITERGWAAHLCVSDNCGFRRNTLVEVGEKKAVVSTVGAYICPLYKRVTEIGHNRYYETMIFNASDDGTYIEAETSNELNVDLDEWAINAESYKDLEYGTDLKANNMHEEAVRKTIEYLKENQ